MKRNKEWNKAKFERFMKEGRGQGDLNEYKPWLTIQDLPSKGRATRIYGWKTRRIHHFFSDIQTRFFYLLEWEESIIDIKEHFPLLDLKDTLLFNDIDIEKYVSEDGTDYIFTTTFLMKVLKNTKVQFIARSIKAYHELDRKGTIERFEIERRYWEKKGVDWGIVTNKEIPIIRAKNIEWLHSSLELDLHEILKQEDRKILSNELISMINANPYSNVRQVTNDFDNYYALETGTGLLLFKYLIMKKIIVVDMDKKIEIGLPIYKIIENIRG